MTVEPTETTKANEEWEPRIVAYCCNWCSYAGADLTWEPTEFSCLGVILEIVTIPVVTSRHVQDGQ
jgi:hypothetical protein